MKKYGIAELKALWNDLQDHARVQRAWRKTRDAARLTWAIGRYFITHRGSLQASALAFVTVFSLVPLAAVMLGAIAWSTTESDLRKWMEPVIAQVLPDIDIGQDLAVRLEGANDEPEPPPTFVGPPPPEDDVLEQAKAEVEEEKREQLVAFVVNQLLQFQQTGAPLGLMGGLAMLIIALMLFNTIEMAVNDIWQVRKGRSSLWKIVVFTAMLIYVPLFLGLSVWLGREVMRHDAIIGVVWVGPLVFSILFFFLFNYLVPYARVKMGAAICGGVFSGVMFELAKLAFAMYIRSIMGNYENIYGFLAIFPILLLWVYYIWVITLLGTHIAHGLQVGTDALLLDRIRTLPQRTVAWRICSYVADCFQKGRPTGDSLALAGTLRLPTPQVERVMDDLVRAGLLARAHGYRATILPTCPLEQLTINQVLEAVEPTPKVVATPAGVPDYPHIDEWEETMRASLPNMTMKQAVT